MYESGFSHSALLILAKQHNEFNQIQCTTSFPEIAACYRWLLFSHFAWDVEGDGGVNMPDILCYNMHTRNSSNNVCNFRSAMWMLVYIHMYMSTCVFINDASKTLSKSVNILKGAIKITANGINSLKNI